MIQARNKNPIRRQIADPKPKIQTKNSYDILSQFPEEDELQDPHAGVQAGKAPSTTTPPPDPPKETNTEDAGDADGDIHMHMNART